MDKSIVSPFFDSRCILVAGVDGTVGSKSL